MVFNQYAANMLQYAAKKNFFCSAPLNFGFDMQKDTHTPIFTLSSRFAAIPKKRGLRTGTICPLGQNNPGRRGDFPILTPSPRNSPQKLGDRPPPTTQKSHFQGGFLSPGNKIRKLPRQPELYSPKQQNDTSHDHITQLVWAVNLWPVIFVPPHL